MIKFLETFYDGNYKRYLAVPAILAVVFLLMVFAVPGIKQGIELTGGTMIIFKTDKPINQEKLAQSLSRNFELSDLSVSTTTAVNGYGVNIQFAENKTLKEARQELGLAKAEQKAGNDANAKQHALKAISIAMPSQKAGETGETEELIAQAEEALNSSREKFFSSIQALIIKEFGIGEDSAFQIREVGPALGKTFWNTALTVSLASLVLVTLVIFFFFREFIPSVAIIQAGIFDVLAALALMAFFSIPLSLSTIPALLMLLGYSVDTDIILTTKVMKRTGKTARQRAVDSMKTGLTMTFCAMAMLATMIVISYANQMTIIFEIAAVLLFGLAGDLIATWLANAPIILWYVESKGPKGGD